jgi:hypothetical protein
MTDMKQPDWIPDWKNTDDYPKPAELGREHWAWQFLRRNQEYQNGWERLSKKSPRQESKISGGTLFEFSEEWNKFASNWGIRGPAPNPAEATPKGLVFDSSLILTISRFDGSASRQQILAPKNKKEIVIRVPLEKSMSLLTDAFNSIVTSQQNIIGFSHKKNSHLRFRKDKLPGYLQVFDADSIGVDLPTFVSQLFPHSNGKEYLSKIKTYEKALDRACEIVETDYMDFTDMTILRRELARQIK